MMTSLLVSTWETACGIAEHAAYLKVAIEAADAKILVSPRPQYLDPGAFFVDHTSGRVAGEVLHLNYQAGLLSRWTPETIREAQKRGYKVIVTYHDTGVPNSDHCKAIIDAADAAVVHEPFDDLPIEKTHYWRMGVPDWAQPYHFPWPLLNSWCGRRPILGTIGFPFPWKHYDQLAKVTAAAGWAFYVIAPGATEAQIAQWTTINPHTLVNTHFTERGLAVSYLSACDATAFTYVCHNTGQSAAILQGIAARKPVIALRTCRQFRALAMDELGSRSILWRETFEEVEVTLTNLQLGRVDLAIVALAHQERWSEVGARYAALYWDTYS